MLFSHRIEAVIRRKISVKRYTPRGTRSIEAGRYRFREYKDSGVELSEVKCSYAYYYTFPLNYYECTQINRCQEEAEYLVSDIKKCAKSGEDEPDYQYLYSGKCHPNYEAAKAKDDDTTIAKIYKEKDTVPRRPYICCFLQLY